MGVGCPATSPGSSVTMHSAPSGTGASAQPHRTCRPEGAAWNIRSKALVLPTRRRRPESPWHAPHLTLHLSPRSELSRLFPIGARRGRLPSALALEILLLVNALPRQEKPTGPWTAGQPRDFLPPQGCQLPVEVGV